MVNLKWFILISAVLSLHLCTGSRLMCECGNTNVAPRVVGGAETLPYEYPWIAFLVIFKSLNSKSATNCDATIINDKVLLTAGHCVTTRPPNAKRRIVKHPGQFLAIFHTWDRADDRNTPTEFVMKVEKVIVHPSYVNIAGQGPNDYDIALLILAERIDINQLYFNPVCLPKSSEIIITENRDATVAGWGMIARGDPATLTPPKGTNRPHKLKVPLHSKESCLAYVPFLKPNFNDIFICADYWDERGAAQGDSGGPLFLDMPSGGNVQIGIVSNGITANRTTKAALTLYTRVTYYLDWIEYHSVQSLARWCSRPSNEIGHIEDSHSPAHREYRQRTTFHMQ